MVNRREMIGVGAVVLTGLVGYQEFNKYRQHQHFIPLNEALSRVPKDTRANLLNLDGYFDVRIKKILQVLNSIEGKTPNKLLTDGADLALRNQYRFLLASNRLDNFTIDRKKKELAISDYFPNSNGQTDPEIKEIVILSRVIGALAQLMAVELAERIPEDEWPRPREGGAIDSELRTIVRNRVAPVILGKLIAVRIAFINNRKDLHEIHLFGDWELHENLRNYMSTEFIAGAFLSAFKDKDLRDSQLIASMPSTNQQERDRFVTATVKFLLEKLGFDKLTVGRRSEF